MRAALYSSYAAINVYNARLMYFATHRTYTVRMYENRDTYTQVLIVFLRYFSSCVLVGRHSAPALASSSTSSGASADSECVAIYIHEMICGFFRAVEHVMLDECCCPFLLFFLLARVALASF